VTDSAPSLDTSQGLNVSTVPSSPFFPAGILPSFSAFVNLPAPPVDKREGPVSPPPPSPKVLDASLRLMNSWPFALQHPARGSVVTTSSFFHYLRPFSPMYVGFPTDIAKYVLPGLYDGIVLLGFSPELFLLPALRWIHLWIPFDDPGCPRPVRSEPSSPWPFSLKIKATPPAFRPAKGGFLEGLWCQHRHDLAQHRGFSLSLSLSDPSRSLTCGKLAPLPLFLFDSDCGMEGVPC